MKTLARGGFTHVTRLASALDLDLRCAFCSSIDALAWLHVASHVVVCRRCLADPYAGEGETGLRSVEQLERRLQREREERDAPLVA